MRNRTLLSGIFLISFAIALAHNTIPHTHPEISNQTSAHEHRGSRGHHDHDRSQDHHNSDEKHPLPVFSHFSNTDFTGSARFEFFAKEKFLIDVLLPVGISFVSPDVEKQILCARAREHPADRLRSLASLRAPPFLS